MAAVTFTLQTGEKFVKTVEDTDDAAELAARFVKGADAFAGKGPDPSEKWIEVDDGAWILRGAIVAVAPLGEGGMVAWGS